MLIFNLQLTGCPDPVQPVPFIPKLIAVELDTLWILHSERYHTIAVRVWPPEIAQDREMIGIITGGEIREHFRLYDDGGYGRWQDSAGFADSLSGDVIPKDGVYSRRLNSTFTTIPGVYSFVIGLSDSPPPDSLIIDITVRPNNPPTLRVLALADSVASGGRGWFSAQVKDEDGKEDIQLVQAALKLPRVFPEDYQTFTLFRENDTLWSRMIGPEIAVGFPTGFHKLRLRTADFYMLQTQEWVNSAVDSVWLENKPPAILSVDGPDTIWIPPDHSDSIKFGYDIQVEDEQTAADIDSLLLTIILWDGGQVRYCYFDNGQRGDSLAGDGFFYAGFSVNNRNTTGVTHTFEWTAADRSPQRGESKRTFLTLMSGTGPSSSEDFPGHPSACYKADYTLIPSNQKSK